MPNKHRLWLCITPLLLFLLNIGLTLWGQPPSYRRGEFSTAREALPEVYRVMSVHPGLFFLMIVVWMLVTVALTTWLPEHLARWSKHNGNTRPLARPNSTLKPANEVFGCASSCW